MPLIPIVEVQQTIGALPTTSAFACSYHESLDRARIIHIPSGTNIINLSTLHWDSVLMPIHANIAHETKYTRLTGKRNKDIDADFLYHWMTGFTQLASTERLRKALLDKETACALSTVVALNKFIHAYDLTEKHQKQLLFKSPYRWKKTLQNEWIPATFYPVSGNNYNRLTFFLNHGELLFSRPDTFSSLLSFNEYLTLIATTLDVRPRQTRELMAHSTKATDSFRFKFKQETKITKNPLFLGIELELEGFSSKEYITLDTLDQHAIFKRDGSLTNGVEICTAPATLDIHKQEFETFFNSIKNNKSKLKATETCGLHIHIDRKTFSLLHIANLYKLINNQKNNESLTKIAGREPNRYCEKHEVAYDYFTQDGGTSKYRQVNLSPEETIELRLFASTIDFPTFASRLEFAQAVVDYTRPGEVAIPTYQVPLWNNFVSYVSSHKKFYPYLAKEI